MFVGVFSRPGWSLLLCFRTASGSWVWKFVSCNK